jgi:hypothetical protein
MSRARIRSRRLNGPSRDDDRIRIDVVIYPPGSRPDLKYAAQELALDVVDLPSG